jgi:CheY-like chemotaxis protein
MNNGNNQSALFLIVDDESDLCWALERILHEQGLHSQKALNGKAALALMQKHRFKLAFLDFKLPDMDGFQLARLIRERDPLIRIVIISGFISKSDGAVAQAQAAGLISGFINKPFLHAEILKAIELSAGAVCP